MTRVSEIHCLARNAASVLLAMSICGSGLGQEAPPEGEASNTYVYECADAGPFVVDIQGGVAWLFLPQGTVRATRAVSASGEKYRDGEVVFWSKGEEASFDTGETVYRGCRNNRAKAIWENAKLRGIDFRAVGNEPGWVLEISGSSYGPSGDLHFVGAYGEERFEFPSALKSTDAQSRVTTFTADTDLGRFTVRLSEGPCYDSMSGERFEVTVAVDVFGREYSGCGKPLH